MVLSSLFHKGDLGTLYSCAIDRIEAVNAGKLTVIRCGDNETELALALRADRIGALAKKLETALCERPVFLTQDDRCKPAMRWSLCWRGIGAGFSAIRTRPPRSWRC